MITSYHFGANGLDFYVDGHLAERIPMEDLIRGLGIVIDERNWSDREGEDEFHFEGVRDDN